MDETTPERPRIRERIGQRAWVRPAAWFGGGLLAGGILAGTVTAAAAEDEAGTGTTGGYGYGAPADDDRDGDGFRGRHHGGGRGGGPGAGEEELTGATADSVREAVLAEYPDATIERLETDADGVYEAHITTADGDRVTVELGEDFAITGTE
jgi:hypothetical protein